MESFSNNNESTINPLTSQQQQRCDYLRPLYGPEISEQIIRNLTNKGRFSWQSFLDKMDHVRKAKTSEKEYYDALYESFELGKVYSPGEIIGIVGTVRRDMGLEPYLERIKIQSEHDFFLVFVAKEVFLAENDTDKKKLIGYNPVVRVKPD